ncbi:MAG: hypothetical protein R3F61_16200 [Myxococcota bacterium]
MSQSPDPHAMTSYALATWVFLLRVDGVEPDDAELASHCAAVMDAAEEAVGNAAGERLVERVKAMLAGISPDDVTAFARTLYGDRVNTGLGGGERSDRLSRIRKYQFDRNLPWLARIWERNGGEVVPSWLIVNRVTDEVTAVDPNPWNDIDETRHVPVVDFQVLWELDGCTAVALA